MTLVERVTVSYTHLALFTSDDLPDYKTYSFYECPACQEKRKIDAIVNSYGYSKI